MQCCRWKRSSNDALLDSGTSAEYCGTCWQNWIELQGSQGNRKNESSSQRDTKGVICTTSIARRPALVEDDSSIGELEGFSHTDGKMYLLSRNRNLVFLSERSEDGKFQCVGEIVPSSSKATSIKIYNVENVSKTITFPFPTAPEDHCETPFEAYADLACYLEYFASTIGKSRETLSIWDPFYCDGAVKRHFTRLGFANVHNECEDFYAVIGCGNLPKHDCIVTNPPYSTTTKDHVEQLLQFLCSQTKPWFVVQPNYVYVKPYWELLTSQIPKGPRPFFLTPATPRKYKYKTPSGIRHVSSAQHLKTSPFVSMWYCWLGVQYTEKMYRWIASKSSETAMPLSLACAEYYLPDSFKDSNDRTRRKRKKTSVANDRKQLNMQPRGITKDPRKNRRTGKRS